MPGVSWSDVGALACVREELSLSILEPIAYPEVSKSFHESIRRVCPPLLSIVDVFPLH